MAKFLKIEIENGRPCLYFEGILAHPFTEVTVAMEQQGVDPNSAYEIDNRIVVYPSKVRGQPPIFQQTGPAKVTIIPPAGGSAPKPLPPAGSPPANDHGQLTPLVAYIEANIDVAKAAQGPDFYYASLPLCIIDSVFSIQARWHSVVFPRVTAWAESQRWQLKKSEKSELKRPTIDEFIHVVEEINGNDDSFERLANKNALNYRGRVAANKSAILKAEAVYRFAKALRECGINDYSDLKDRKKLEDAEAKVKNIKGQRSGLTFKYFLMLSGDESLVKGDTMLSRYVATALGIKKIDPLKAEKLVIAAAEKLKHKYVGLTPARLDYAIWNYQRVKGKDKKVYGPDDACGTTQG
jgi:hypothetical protein